MATYLIVFSISLFILSYSFVECNKRTLSYTNTTYTHNENVNFTSIISDDGSMNFYLTTFKDLENFVIDLNVFVKNENSVTFREKINNTLDICRLLENAGSNMYIGRILEPLLKNKENKIIRKCPIEKGDYYLKGYRHDTSKMPPIVPDMEFHTTVTVWESALKNKKLIFVYVSGKLENERKVQGQPTKKTRQPK